MSDGSERAREALSMGRLEFDLLGVPLPRTGQWRYAVKLCGHPLASADGYSALVGVHRTAQAIEIPPGEHELEVVCEADDGPAWRWSAPVSPPDKSNTPTVHEVACRDRLPPAFGLKTYAAERPVRLLSVEGHVEVVWPAEDDGPARAEAAKAGAELEAGALIVTGPAGRAVLEVGQGEAVDKVVVRAMTVLPVSEAGRPVVFSAEGPSGPTLRVGPADGMSFLKSDGHPTAVCSVLG